MTRETTDSAIYNGVRLLDEKGPADWRDRLKLRATINEPFDNLAMEFGRAIESDTRVCVLAHIFGSFSEGCEMLGIRCSQAYIYGFEIDDEDPRLPSEKYRELNAVWKAWFGYAS